MGIQVRNEDEHTVHHQRAALAPDADKNSRI